MDPSFTLMWNTSSWGLTTSASLKQMLQHQVLKMPASPSLMMHYYKTDYLHAFAASDLLNLKLSVELPSVSPLPVSCSPGSASLIDLQSKRPQFLWLWLLFLQSAVASYEVLSTSWPNHLDIQHQYAHFLYQNTDKRKTRIQTVA
jgi:hypothetical protein